jgi:hypothetical protein
MSDTKWMVSRPNEIMQLLPPAMRWECTRRNPLYLMFWNTAQRIDGLSTEKKRLVHDAAKLILLLIGVTGDPPSPALRADELDAEEIKSIWRDGAIAPMSIRGLVSILVGHLLTAETKKTIADLILRSLDVSAADPQANLDLISAVSKTANPQFDLHLPSLAVTINPLAPQRAIASAIEQIVQDYKTSHGIPEKRRRDDKLDEYLAVWDAREGWNGEGYDRQNECSFKGIARRTKKSISTLSNQYQSAFKYIIGHDYSPELWSFTIGIAKMAGRLGGGPSKTAQNRPMITGRKREVPNSVVSISGETHEDVLKNAGFDSTDISQFELYEDIGTLIKAERTTDQIIAELELGQSNDAIKLIAYYRNRLAEHGGEYS